MSMILRAVALWIVLPASVAFSSFDDSALQIKSILESAEVADALRQAPIESIEREGNRSDGAIKWEIETKDCDLDVYLTPAMPDQAGKAAYQVEVNDLCR